MGSLFEFTCECGYHCRASGGEDIGFTARVQTMTCHNCNDVLDVLIGTAQEGMPFPDKGFQKRIGKCHQCKGVNLSPWPETHPCPKCHQHMRQDGPVLLWD